MPRNYVRTRQSDVVTPTRPTSSGADSPNLPAARPHSCIPLRPPTYCHDEIRQPSSSPQHPAIQPPIRHMCQLRPSYDHSTNSTPFRYESRFLSYDRCRMSYLRVDTAPPNIPAQRPAEIRQPSPTRPSRLPCDSFVSYGPDTPMRRMRRLSDTKKLAPATTTVARPIWRATVSNTNSRPIHLNQHYETRPADQRLFAIRLLPAKRFHVMAPAPRPHQQPTCPPPPQYQARFRLTPTNASSRMPTARRQRCGQGSCPSQGYPQLREECSRCPVLR